MKSKKKQSALYCESSTDYRIVDETGSTITIEEAKKRWESGVHDWNLAIGRLAVDFSWDIDKLREYYMRKV